MNSLGANRDRWKVRNGARPGFLVAAAGQQSQRQQADEERLFSQRIPVTAKVPSAESSIVCGCWAGCWVTMPRSTNTLCPAGPAAAQTPNTLPTSASLHDEQ